MLSASSRQTEESSHSFLLCNFLRSWHASSHTCLPLQFIQRSVLSCCADVFDGLYNVRTLVPNCLESLSGSLYHLIKFLQPLAKINIYVCSIWGGGWAGPLHFLVATLSQNYSQKLYSNTKKRH